MMEVDAPKDASPEQLARTRRGSVYGFCLSFLKNPDDAEDACQETFLAIVRHRDDLRDVRDPSSWMMKIALRSCLWIRRKRLRNTHEDLPEIEETVPTAPPPIAGEDVATVRRAIDRLPDRYRAILMLRFQQGLGHDQIAETMELSREAARVLLHRSIAKLREEVRPR